MSKKEMMKKKEKQEEQTAESKRQKGLGSFLMGVKFLAKKNTKSRYFVTSKKNYFGGFQIENIMIDSGCNTHLLPLAEGDLDKLAKLFPNEKFLWTIRMSPTVHSCALTLVIKAAGGHPFPVILDEDNFKANFGIPHLRFHLCSEDQKILLSDLVLNTNNELFLDEDAKDILRQVPPEANLKRRKHALLGQHILSSFASIQQQNTFMMIDGEFPSKDYKFWDQLEKIDAFVVKIDPNLLPTNFDDLEDEDHDGADECYTFNSPQEFIDE